MLPALILLTCANQFGAGGSPQPPALELPKPHFQQQPDDPPWLVQLVQFHGHLGPSVVAGAQFGIAGLRAVGAKGFFDVEVTCEGPFVTPPQSCFLDGLQVGTGATLGKRSLQWVPADVILVRVKNTRTGRAAELRPTPILLALLTGVTHQAETGSQRSAKQEPPHEHLETVARKIASLPEKEIVSIVTIPVVTP